MTKPRDWMELDQCPHCLGAMKNGRATAPRVAPDSGAALAELVRTNTALGLKLTEALVLLMELVDYDDAAVINRKQLPPNRWLRRVYRFLDQKDPDEAVEATEGEWQRSDAERIRAAAVEQMHRIARGEK